MKRIMILMYLLSVVTSVAFAQKSFSIAMLKSKEWIIETPMIAIPSIKRGWFFDNTIMNRYIELSDGKRADIKVEYYLSDDKEGAFDKQKVGTTTHGKYIVANKKQIVGENPTERYITERFEIVSLSQTELVVISPAGTRAVLKAKK